MNRKQSINGPLSKQPTQTSKVLQPEQKNDPIRNYLKSLQLQKAIILPLPNVQKRHQQFIVDSHKFNQLNNVSAPIPGQRNGIREEIDTCLDAITAVYEQSKMNISADTCLEERGSTSLFNQAEGKQNVIHRIDPDLIIEYINTVYKDYQIRNRFASLKSESKQGQQQLESRPQTKAQLSIQTHQRQSIPSNTPKVIVRQNAMMSNENGSSKQEKCYSSRRDSTIKKKHYLQLTQLSRQQRKSSTVERSNARETINSKTERPTVVSRSNPSYHQHLYRRPNAQKNEATSVQKISEEFRYCINCQKPILSVNIDHHEQYQCQTFKSLYQMNYVQLKDLVRDKIQRMKKELKEKICLLRRNQGKDELLLVNEGKIVVDNIESYLSGIQAEKESGSDVIKSNVGEYVKFKESLRTTLSQAIELTNKLHLFVKIYNKIVEELVRNPQRSSNGRESLNRIAYTPRISKIVARSSAASVQKGNGFPFVTPFQTSSRQ